MKKSSLKFKTLYKKNLQYNLKNEKLYFIPGSEHELNEKMKMKRSKAEKSRMEGKRPHSANKAIKRSDSMNTRYGQAKKKIDESKLIAFERDIGELLQNRQGGEKEILKEELEIILSFLDQRDQEKFETKFNRLEDNLSKLLKNRLSHLIFYFIFAHYLELAHHKDKSKSYQKETKKLILCEYYSRKLSLYQITFQICMRIQELYIRQIQYDESRRYARKCLRLAVFMRDKDAEFEVIQNFKIINYYRGVIATYSNNFITKKERKFIWENYHPEDELPEIFEGKRRDPAISYVYDFQNEANYIDKPEFSNNYFQFVRNYNFINKNMTQISKDVKKTLRKVTSIGKIHKYIDDNCYIELMPRSPNILPQNQGQVFLTHRKRTVSQKQSEDLFSSFYFPRYKKIIEKFCI